jgi:general secretion pathway protein D
MSVWGSQGSPQGSDEQGGPAKTPGSSMKSCIQTQASSKSVFPMPAFSGATRWIALFAALVVVGLSSAELRAQSASSFFKRGETAEAHEDYDAAFDNYQKAYNKAPKDLRYRASLYRVRATAASVHVTKGQKLLDAGNEQGALAEFLHAAEIDPSNEAAQQDIARVRQKHGEVTPVNETSLPVAPGKEAALDSMSAPAILRPVSDEPLTLHMQEDAKVVYQAVGKAAGINVLFDPDPSLSSKRIQVDLNSVSLLDALRIVGTISNTFWRPVTENTIFVAANTRARHTELDEQAVQTFYLSNAWQQNDLTDVQTAIRNVLPSAKVYAVASQNAIVMRGTPDELLLAEKLINDLDKARPEVVVDIAVLEVSKNWEKTLGIAWPSSVGVALQPSCATTNTCSTSTSTSGSTTTTTPTLYDLAHLKASNFAVTVGSATANLLLTDTDTKILQNPRIRATDGQKAIMKIGSKIPIATGSYQTGAATAVVSSLVNTQFQYQDVGVNIEMTPTVHFDRDVTLKIKIEVTAQSGSVTISGVTEPIISQRTVDQVIRLREGEASILGGIQDKQDTASSTGIPGLSSLPVLKYIFGSKDHTINDDELVFLVVPHVVRSQSLEQVNLRTVDTGEGTNIQLRQISDDGTNPATKPTQNPVVIPASPPRPPVNAQPNVGTVPGESAMAAAPGALKQMSQAAETTGNTVTPARPTSPQTASDPQPAKVSFMLTPQPGPVVAGASFQVPVVLNGGANIAAVPLQISYDPARLSLVNIDSGNFLSSDGQAVALVHRDEGPGTINVVASRPPGAAGVNGSGVVCVLTFQAKTAGDSVIAITRPGAVNSTQQQLPATGAQVSIQVK